MVISFKDLLSPFFYKYKKWVHHTFIHTFHNEGYSKFDTP